MAKKAPNGAGYIALGYRGKQIGGVRKFDHVRIVEEVYGRPLPEGAVVHHANGDKLDNRKENLVVCPNRAYHNLLHKRMDALNACGHVDWQKCRRCGQYDDPGNLSSWPNGTTRTWGHAECERRYTREYLRRKKERTQ